jgi:hypothetical protein
MLKTNLTLFGKKLKRILIPKFDEFVKSRIHHVLGFKLWFYICLQILKT